jgi:hypothetical protein
VNPQNKGLGKVNFFNFDHSRYSSISSISSKAYVPGCIEILGLDALNGISAEFSDISESSLISLIIGSGLDGPSTILDGKFRSQHQGDFDKLFTICDVESYLPPNVFFCFFF